MNRRMFIGGLAISASIPLFGISFLRWLDARTPEQYVWQILKTHLPYLSVSPETVKEFTRDHFSLYQSRYGVGPRRSKFIFTFERWIKMRHHSREDLLDLEVSIARDFLLATDFFSHGSDTRRYVQYEAVFNPYVNVCRNPFRRGLL